jgi:hypothetical protein
MKTPSSFSLSCLGVLVGVVTLSGCGGDVLDAAPQNPACLEHPCGSPAEPDAGALGDAATTTGDAGGGSAAGDDTASSPSPLGFDVVDATFSAPLSSIVLVSSTPAFALHVYDTTTHVERAIALPESPIAVSLDPAGTHAAVAFGARVAWVDLATVTLTATCATQGDLFDVALSNDGTAYAMPKAGAGVPLETYDVTCRQTLEGAVDGGSHLALHPSGAVLFTANVSPIEVDRCDLVSSPVTCESAWNGEGHAVPGVCARLWASGDGSRLYTSCAAVLDLTAPPNAAPVSVAGTLAGVSSITHLAEAPLADRLVLIPGDTPSYFPVGTTPGPDTHVRIHDASSFALLREISLPAFPDTGSGAATAHGRFVFTTPKMGMIYVLVQADPASPLAGQTGLVTIRL